MLGKIFYDIFLSNLNFTWTINGGVYISIPPGKFRTFTGNLQREEFGGTVMYCSLGDIIPADETGLIM